MYSKSPLNRPTGVQETVIDQEVARASVAQGLAPAAGAPPLLVKSLEPLAYSMLVGAPVLPNHHQRAVQPVLESKQYPESVAFSESEVRRRLNAGGFVDTPVGTMAVFAIPQFEPTAYLGENRFARESLQNPMSSLRTEMHKSGMQFAANGGRVGNSGNSSSVMPSKHGVIPESGSETRLRANGAVDVVAANIANVSGAPMYPTELAMKRTPDRGNSRLVGVPSPHEPMVERVGQAAANDYAAQLAYMQSSQPAANQTLYSNTGSRFVAPANSQARAQMQMLANNATMTPPPAQQ